MLKKVHITPEGLWQHQPRTYTQVIRVGIEPAEVVFISGQVAVDDAGEIVGIDDFGQQAVHVINNLRRALDAAGVTGSDIVKLTTFVVPPVHTVLPAIREALSTLFDRDSPPANTIVGVHSLARPEYLLEIEAIAVPGALV